ncbi:MAG TPA: lysophospholipase [Rhodopila sp.]|nr:lysophospholipase [Rhodopila sp.]HVZ10461.1 lysophospholipase [Rhodopila sp.]
MFLLAACSVQLAPPGPAIRLPAETADAFMMPDGAILPYRAWLPDGRVRAVVLALHGMNDSRDAWEYPAPDFAAQGIAVFSPDQRGFGATSSRGLWPGTAGLVADARVMIRLLRARYPGIPLFAMGESMGAAVLMVLDTQADAPPVDGTILVAPAVWSRSKMNWFLRGSLWLAYRTVPGLTLTGRGIVRVTASDNRDALRRLSANPLTIHGTRVDAIDGLVDLMDQAAAAAPRLHGRMLFLYGGKDELVPPRATVAVWRTLPLGNVTLAYYPAGYHLLLRDKERSVPINDILAWMHDPSAPLPSSADEAAAVWLKQQPQD